MSHGKSLNDNELWQIMALKDMDLSNRKIAKKIA